MGTNFASIGDCQQSTESIIILESLMMILTECRDMGIVALTVRKDILGKSFGMISKSKPLFVQS